MKSLKKVSYETIVKAIFWAHFAVGMLSYVSVFFLVAGCINLLWSADFSFWTRAMLFSLTFFAGMYGVNHVTNDNGFCVLTDVENYYRKLADMPKVGKFTPRFSQTLRSLLKLKKKA